MFHAQLHHEQLEAKAEQYRKEAAVHAEVHAARRTGAGGLRPIRRRFAGMLRHLADTVEPSQPIPSHLLRRNTP